MSDTSTLRFLKIASLLAATLVLMMGFANRAFATKEMFKAAQEKFGKSAITGCKHCHVKPLPTEKDHALNEQGQWLVKEKEKRKAKAVDVSWLADYKESK